MQIRVRLFAVLRESAGTDELMLDLPAGSSASAVSDALFERFPDTRPHLARIAFAVNQSYCQPDRQLHEGDEVALIPPVSGG